MAFGLAVAGFPLLMGRVLGHPPIPYDSQPAWVKTLRGVVSYLPWLACAAIVVARFLKGPGIRAVSFIAGAVTPYAAFVAFILAGPTVSDYAHRRGRLARLEPRLSPGAGARLRAH